MARANGNQLLLRIGELAKHLGTTTKTLRYYERMGLLQPAERTSRGYRVYDLQDQRNAEQVMALRRLGLTIEDVHNLFDSRPGDSTVRQKLLGQLDEKLRDIDETLGILQGRRDDLAARYLSLLDTPRRTKWQLHLCCCSDALPLSEIRMIRLMTILPQIKSARKALDLALR